MGKFFALSVILWQLGWLALLTQASVTATDNPLNEKEDVRDLKENAVEFLKKPPPYKRKPRNRSRLNVQFILPDYRRRARRDRLIVAMKRQINRFNNNPDSDAAMEHFGEPGTFVWLQGVQPIYVFGRDCYSRLVRENADEAEDTHAGFFGKFTSFLRRRFRAARRRRRHANFSERRLRERIKEVRQIHRHNKAMLKDRVLAETPKTIAARHQEAIRSFLQPRKKRKLAGIPAMVKATIDDSYIHITSFARPPIQQSSLIKNPGDTETQVIQTRLRMPMRHLQPKVSGSKSRV